LRGGGTWVAGCAVTVGGIVYPEPAAHAPLVRFHARPKQSSFAAVVVTLPELGVAEEPVEDEAAWSKAPEEAMPV